MCKAIGDLVISIDINELFTLLSEKSLRVSFAESSQVNNGIYLRLKEGIEDLVIEQGEEGNYEIYAFHPTYEPMESIVGQLSKILQSLGIEHEIELYDNQEELISSINYVDKT